MEAFYRKYIISLRDRVRVACTVLVALLCCQSAAAQDVGLITAAGQREMLNAPGTPSVGARDADLSIVEYLDYSCPYCKKFAPELQQLLARDPKIALIYKDWPILSEVSVYAARAALAAQWEGRYLAAHDALMREPKLADDAAVDRTLEHAGFDLTALRKDAALHGADIDALLARNAAEAQALSLRGTPGVVIGRLLLAGTVDLSGLTQLVAQARKTPP
jgi:protein-disulfide isomerase